MQNKTSSSNLTSTNEKIDYAIFAAFPEELNYLNQQLEHHDFSIVKINDFEFKIVNYHDRKCLISYTSIGTIFAASALTFVYDHFQPDAVILTGTAGGIQKQINIGDVVIAENAFEAETQNTFTLVKNTPFESSLMHPVKKQMIQSTYSADKNLLQLAKSIDIDDIKIHKGSVVTSNLFPAPQTLFEKIKERNALCIDMETSAFYQIGWLLNLPVISIRGISNVLDQQGEDPNLHFADVEKSSKAAAKFVLTLLNKLSESKSKDYEHINEK